MKIFTFFLVVMIGLGLFFGCKKSDSSRHILIDSLSHRPSDSLSLTGTHQFFGTADYSSPLSPFSPGFEDDNVPDTFTTVITRPVSTDSANYIYLPPSSVGGPGGGIYLAFSTTPPDQWGVPVAIEVTDTLLTIPNQLPWSGYDLSVNGDGSFVNNKITLRFHSYYRGFEKYDTAVSVR